ncbi:MAG TPA: spore cortex biosynthesis protein YabQ [bacterium]|nr:spore cortex biosynthesis protein YabQ [bacterium]
MLELQLIVIGWTLLSGVLLGFVFDGWRAGRAILHPGRLATSLGDLFFWLLATVTVATALLVSTAGEVRGLYLLSSAIGFMGQQGLVSKHIQRPLQSGLKTIFRCLGQGAVKLGLPVWVPIQYLLRQGVRGRQKGKAIGRAVIRTIKRKIALFTTKKRR